MKFITIILFWLDYRCDVSKESDWVSMWDHCETCFEGKVEVLVNNAGLNPSAGWKLCLDVMLYGVMIGSFLARDRMGLSKVDAILGILCKLATTNSKIMIMFPSNWTQPCSF